MLGAVIWIPGEYLCLASIVALDKLCTAKVCNYRPRKNTVGNLRDCLKMMTKVTYLFYPVFPPYSFSFLSNFAHIDEIIFLPNKCHSESKKK